MLNYIIHNLNRVLSVEKTEGTCKLRHKIILCRIGTLSGVHITRLLFSKRMTPGIAAKSCWNFDCAALNRRREK